MLQEYSRDFALMWDVATVEHSESLVISLDTAKALVNFGIDRNQSCRSLQVTYFGSTTLIVKLSCASLHKRAD